MLKCTPLTHLAARNMLKCTREWINFTIITPQVFVLFEWSCVDVTFHSFNAKWIRKWIRMSNAKEIILQTRYEHYHKESFIFWYMLFYISCLSSSICWYLFMINEIYQIIVLILKQYFYGWYFVLLVSNVLVFFEIIIIFFFSWLNTISLEKMNNLLRGNSKEHCQLKVYIYEII